MSGGAAHEVHVGHVDLPFEDAAGWIRAYTDPGNATVERPYAYPAYDRYDSGSNERSRITDGDLLAPILLNVGVSVRSFSGLQAIRPQLAARLANPDLDVPLEQIDDPSRIEAMVAPLYELLDDPATKPWGVAGTTLSKILHRKAPRSLVLHDRWVRASYVGVGGPLAPEKNRSWASYMTQLTAAIAHDLRSQTELFARLDAAAHSPGELTPVRLLDILAWCSRGGTRAAV